LKKDGGQLAYDVSGVKPADILYNTLATPRGGQYQLILPDGSKVWLNAASSIRYPTAFAGKERRVMITGEAYFEIKQDAAMPFIVSHNDIDVKVLGTSFDVNTYDDEPVVRTTLVEGAVQVKKGTGAVVLEPGQQARVTEAGVVSLWNDVDVEETVAWKNGRFSCKNMALEDIMREVARWYDVDVMYKDKITDRYTLGVARNVPVSSLLRYLEMSEGVHFSVEGKKIIVSK
jgi:ferric-dicitrate binding protein FerR (iron transport regulator)